MSNCNNFDIDKFFKYECDRRSEWENFESPWRKSDGRAACPATCLNCSSPALTKEECPECQIDIVTPAVIYETAPQKSMAEAASASDRTAPTSAILHMANIGSGSFPPGTAVTFNQELVPAPPVSGMSRLSPSTVRLTLPGSYKVDYFFRQQNLSAAMAIFLNDRELPASRYEALSPAEKLSGTAVFALSPSDVPASLALRNVDSKNVALNPGTPPNVVSASMTVTAVSY